MSYKMILKFKIEERKCNVLTCRRVQRISLKMKNVYPFNDLDNKKYFFFTTQIGIDFKQKLINLDGVPIKLQIWDTAGKKNLMHFKC